MADLSLSYANVFSSRLRFKQLFDHNPVLAIACVIVFSWLSVSPDDLRRKAQIDDAIVFWEPFVGRPISQIEAREIIDNMTTFFKILLEWAPREGRLPLHR